MLGAHGGAAELLCFLESVRENTLGAGCEGDLIRNRICGEGVAIQGCRRVI